MASLFPKSLSALAVAAVCSLGVVSSAFAGPCDGDTNGDNEVNVVDLVNVILDWGTDGSANGGDVNASGIVDVSDLTTVVLGWGVCEPPTGCPTGHTCNSEPGSPANDCCDAPTAITLTSVGASQVMSYNTTNAITDGPDDPANPCASAGDDTQVHRDVWYLVTVQQDGFLNVSNCGSGTPTHPGDSDGAFDSKIAGYAFGGAVNCANLCENFIACSEDCATDVTSELNIAATAGTSYMIRLGGYSETGLDADAETGSGSITFELNPINDDCTGAIEMSPGAGPLPSVVSQDLCDATPEAGSDENLPNPGSCGSDPYTTNSLWFRTVGDGSTYTVSLCGTFNLNLDTRLVVFCSTAGGDDCSSLFCDTAAGLFEPIDTCFPFEEISFCTEPGRAYLMYVATASAGCFDGNFTIEVSSFGDKCGAGACDPPVGGCCSGGVCTESILEFDCESTGGVWLLGETCAGLCPANDLCEDAEPISEGCFDLDNTLATADEPAEVPEVCEKGFGLAITNDLWYEYTPSSTGTATISTCTNQNVGTCNEATYDTRLVVYENDCDTLVLIGCNDDGAPGAETCAGFTSWLQVPVTQGVPVLIRAGAFDGANPAGTGTLEVTVEP